MAAIDDRPILEMSPRYFTAADLAAMPSDLPSGPVDYELDNGRFVMMSPTGNRHGSIQSRLSAYLFIQGESLGHGVVQSETGVVLWRNPDRVVGPDVLFVTKNSLPLRESPEAYLETIPELVVEVRSKNDSPAYYQRKVADYLSAGVVEVWIADPLAKTVTAYRANTSPQIFHEDDTLTAEGIIPNFSLPLNVLFKQ